MAQIIIKKGLNIPINGEPVQKIHDHINCKKVSLVGYDYVGLRPKMVVTVGDRVKLGQILFKDKKIPDVIYTSPGSGTVISINRGPKQALESVVIELEGEDEVTFDSFSEDQLDSLSMAKVKSILIESGLWTAIRVRPFSKVANPETSPHSIFVTAIDSNPLAPSIEKIIEKEEKTFLYGLQLISTLTDGKVFLCKSPNEKIPTKTLSSLSIEEFSGPYPAGNVGTHIHFLDPVHRNKIVWHIGVQDIIAIGKLFTTGRICVDRVISLAGPSVKNPRLIRTRIGAALDEITKDELEEGENRVISGSVLSGRTASGTVGFLGRYHQQVSVIPEGRERMLLGWLRPGLNRFSIKSVVLSKLFPAKKFDFDTSLNGAKRAIVPIGSYEKVMPLDILPTFLLRSLLVNDIEEAEKLGCLELDEEDLALCTFVSPSKNDYGPALRHNLSLIEKEG